MKRLILSCTLILCSVVAALAVTKSQVVVYINGKKYYIHTVEPKETIYSIAKEYDISERVLIGLNSADLKAGENIKIPYLTKDEAPKEKGGLFGRKKFSKHTIAKGETLYSISRRYEISIETIIEDNPTVDPIALPDGSELLIRKKMIGKSDEQQSQSEWQEYKADLNLTEQSDGYKYHIVEKGETIYSLSKEAGISESELVEINSLDDGLKAGAIIKLPTQVQQAEMQVEATEGSVEQIGLRTLRHDEKLKVALLLPLSNKERTQRQFVDFYRGFEMGLDSIKTQYGRDIELVLYNTERDKETVYKIIESEQFEGTNLIVGPIYEDLLEPVLRYAEENHIAVVSPLASLKESRSSVLFQMAPLAQTRYEKAEPMFSETKHVTLIYTEQTDALFEAQIMTLLGEREYDTHIYEYEHPNVVAEKIKEEEESAGDLSKFINNEKDNTIVIMSSSETDVDRILSALSSAKINIVARGGKNPIYSVLGNPEWSRFKNIDRTILFNNRVSLLSSYNAKRDNRVVREFDSSYIERYNSLPSLYTYRGYDAAIIFGQGCYSDMEYNLEGRTYTPLQSRYKFKTDHISGVHVNTEWIKINYNNNYTITLE